jgi:predicted DNA-binding transcriptional regulator AlpA
MTREPAALPIPKLLNTEDVCGILQTDRTTLYRLELRGKFPKAMKLGQQKRWRVSDVEAFLAKSFAND